MDLFLTFLLIFICLILLSIAWSSISLAPFVPARKKDLKRIFELADLKQGEIFYDLGCGNGRVVIWAAKNFLIKAVGIEAAWPMWLICELRKVFMKNKKLEFRFGNLFKRDLSEADMVYFFGMPSALKKLRIKLEKELKPGTRVISYAFPVSGWQAEKVDKPKEGDVAIYLYKIK